MQNEWWMRPALQKSEAVLLPALDRRPFSAPRFSHRFTHTKGSDDPFLPVREVWPAQETHALSTYVRPRGSMAGRSVLRAAGISATPYGMEHHPHHPEKRSCLTRLTRRRFY